MFMRVNGKKTMHMGLVFILQKMVLNFKVSFNMICNKGREKKYGLRELDIRVNMKMEKNKAKENFIG